MLGEPIRKEFDLTDAQLGLLGTAFTLVYAAVGLPIGRLADTWVRTRLISIGVSVWSVLTAASGLVTSYSGLVVARLGVGVGESTCSPASQSLIGDLFPPEKRSRALGVFMLGLPFGLCLSYVTGRGWGTQRMAYPLRGRGGAGVHRCAADAQTTRAAARRRGRARASPNHGRPWVGRRPSCKCSASRPCGGS